MKRSTRPEKNHAPFAKSSSRRRGCPSAQRHLPNGALANAGGWGNGEVAAGGVLGRLWRRKSLPLTLALSPRKGGERGRGGVHQARGNPRARRPAYDRAAPLTEGCSMEAYQEVRAEMQLGRGYANR